MSERTTTAPGRTVSRAADPDRELDGQRDREHDGKIGWRVLWCRREQPEPAADRPPDDRKTVQADLRDPPAAPARLGLVDRVGDERGDRPGDQPGRVRPDPGDRDEDREQDERGRRGTQARAVSAVGPITGSACCPSPASPSATVDRASCRHPAWIVMISGPSGDRRRRRPGSAPTLDEVHLVAGSRRAATGLGRSARHPRIAGPALVDLRSAAGRSRRRRRS